MTNYLVSRYCWVAYLPLLVAVSVASADAHQRAIRLTEPPLSDPLTKTLEEYRKGKL